MAAKQDEALGTLKSGFEEKFGQARELLGEITRQAEALRAESGNAQEATSQMARALLQLEAADAARTNKAAGPSNEEIAAQESACSLLAAAPGIGNDGGAGAMERAAAIFAG